GLIPVFGGPAGDPGAKAVLARARWPAFRRRRGLMSASNAAAARFFCESVVRLAARVFPTDHLTRGMRGQVGQAPSRRANRSTREGCLGLAAARIPTHRL